MRRRTLRGLAVAAGALMALMAFLSGTAGAATLTTRYPGIDVRPGDRVTLSLQVEGRRGGEVVELEAVTVPAGWQVHFRGGGFVVHRVYARDDQPAFVDLVIRVPDGVEPGTYPLTVRARGPGGTSELSLSLRVNPQAAVGAGLSAEFPVLQGPAGARFLYRVELRNDGTERLLFNLAAEAPAGWNVTFRPAFGSQDTTSIPVDAGASERIDVTVQAPQRVEAGAYPIVVHASAPGAEAAVELQAVITGTHRLEIRPPDDRFSTRATAGRETPLKIELRNTGTAPLRNVRLSSFEPSGWTVRFDPDSVDLIPPGEGRQVTVLIKPKERALAGDYILTLDARADQASDSKDFRVTVTTSTAWGVVGLLLVAAAVVGTAHVFRTYGRR